MLLAVNVTVLGTDYSLYAHVHHSYGLNDAFDRSVAHLLSARQLDSNTESALQDSVQQKPLDQDDTAVAAEGAAEAAPEGRRLAQDESLLATTAADRAAVEAAWPAQHGSSLYTDMAAGIKDAGDGRLQQHESLPADAAADREAADGGRLDIHESSASTIEEPNHGRHLLANMKDDIRYVTHGIYCNMHLVQHASTATCLYCNSTGLSCSERFRKTQSLFDRGSATVTQHGQAEESIQLLSSRAVTHGIIRRQTSSSLRLAVGDRRRSMLQEGVQVSHPCLHEGYSKDYTWVAHGAHVTPLPKVQLLGRYHWSQTLMTLLCKWQQSHAS